MTTIFMVYPLLSTTGDLKWVRMQVPQRAWYSASP